MAPTAGALTWTTDHAKGAVCQFILAHEFWHIWHMWMDTGSFQH